MRRFVEGEVGGDGDRQWSAATTSDKSPNGREGFGADRFDLLT